MQTLVFSPRFWGVILAVAAILGVTGPFGTYAQLSPLPRFAYWLGVALATFAVGFPAIRMASRSRLGGASPRLLRAALAGLTAGIPVTAVVLLFNAALFGGPTPPSSEVAALFVNCVLIAGAISFLGGLLRERQVPPAGEAAESAAPQAQPEASEVAPTPAPADRRPPLIERLPHSARGQLQYLSMQDHYVEVHTDRGMTLVLMRLADAIRETGSVEGVQIHRSHWVALDAVAGTTRKDGKLFLKMHDGALLPVSRGHTAAARAAGLS